MTLTSENGLGATIALIACGATGFGISPILQHQASRAARRNPEIVGTLNISAFNLDIAGGAVQGGRVVASIGVHAVTWVGAIGVSVLLALAIDQRTRHPAHLAGWSLGRARLTAGPPRERV